MADLKPVTKRSKKQSEPRYIQLARKLRADILADKFAGEADFPTESALCKKHGVSRFTVREALRVLQDEGLIARKRGSGTTVRPPSARGGTLHQPLSNVGELLQYARDSKITFSEGTCGPVPGEVAEQIGKDLAGKWRCFRGVRMTDCSTLPIAVTDAYFHERLGDAVDSFVLDTGTLFAQIEKATGLTVGNVDQEIQAVAATRDIAELLQIEEGEPTLRIIRCYLDPEDVPFEISVSYHPGSRFAYSMRIDMER